MPLNFLEIDAGNIYAWKKNSLILSNYLFCLYALSIILPSGNTYDT